MASCPSSGFSPAAANRCFFHETARPDATLGKSLTDAFATPARASVILRLSAAVAHGQISPDADLDAVVDLLMAIIVFVGVSRDDIDRIPAALRVIRSGIANGRR